jgi:hypothetical protein
MCRALALVVALLIAPTSAFAQGRITGTVTDSSGRALPGVTIMLLTPPSTAAAQTTVTDRNGGFALTGLDPSRIYTVGFLLPGFDPEWRTDVRVTTGGPPLEISLRPGALAETQTLPRPWFFRPGPPLMPQIPGRMCLHDVGESDAEAQRRIEALGAMRLIARAVVAFTGNSRPARFPSWEALAASPAVDMSKQGSGAIAELARKMAWGSAEPLPGWRLSYVATLVDVRFALADERDPCGFTYSSADPQVIPPMGRVRPLT